VYQDATANLLDGRVSCPGLVIGCRAIEGTPSGELPISTVSIVDFVMSRPGSLVRLFVQGLLSAVALLLMLLRPCAAQRALPDPALLPGSNPLCDGIAVHCLDMDDLAGHANVNLQVLPHTERRDAPRSCPSASR